MGSSPTSGIAFLRKHTVSLVSSVGEHGTLNPRVVGSSPTSGVYIAFADDFFKVISVSFLKLIQTLQNKTYRQPG